MTIEEARNLTPEEDYVHFAKSNYLVAGIREQFGTVFVGIYDERPHNDHVDYIHYSSLKPSVDYNTDEITMGDLREMAPGEHDEPSR